LEVPLTHFFLLFLLLILSGFFAATETALFSVNKVKIRRLAEEGNRKAKRLNKMLGNPNRLKSTILIGNNVVNIGATALATSLAIGLFGSKGAGIATAVMTTLILVLGEITPKTLAARKAEAFSLAVGNCLNYLGIVLSPLISFLDFLTRGLVQVMGGEKKEHPFITEEELRMLVNVGEEEGFIDEDEREMIDSILEFDDTLVREVMVPRIDIIAVSVNEPLEEIINLVLEVGHSRIPVYEQNIDNIIGVLYAKDLLKPLSNREEEIPAVRQLIRPAYYVPETKKVRDLLKELRKEKVHMAIVLDEYGGTAGLVTIEDLIEEIVGDIQDEYDQEEVRIETLPDGSYLVDARTSIYDINELLDLDLPDDEFDTISGLVFHSLGRIPNSGQELELGDLYVVVKEVIGRRITKLHLRKTGEKKEE
jgi:putative hemolysin